MKKARSYWRNFKRLVRMRLAIPLLRSQNPPKYNARGVAVGMAWAMTPLIGIQMPLVLITWVIARKIFRWNFSLILACAWTWITNVFTLGPTYYVFYVTGQLMRGRQISGYRYLKRIIVDTFIESDLSLAQKWTFFFKLVLEDWGVSMVIGCLPWVVLSYVLGYYLTMRWEKLRATHRARLEQERRCHEAGH